MEEVEFKTPEATNFPARMTAFKVWVADIKDQEFKQKENSPDYVEVNGRNVSRVNVVAIVVDKFESEKYSSLTLDDSSGQIRLKAFGESIALLTPIQTGDIISTISRLRNFNNENYLFPEIVRKVDPKYAELRKLELTIEHGKREEEVVSQQVQGMQQQTSIQSQQSQQSQQTQQAQQTNQTNQMPSVQEQKPAEPIIPLKKKVQIELEKLDEGEGVEVTSLQASLEEDQENIRKVLGELVGEGEAYEPRPGRFKLI